MNRKPTVGYTALLFSNRTYSHLKLALRTGEARPRSQSCPAGKDHEVKA